MKVAIGADHNGLQIKQMLLENMKANAHDVTDIGAYSLDFSDDYPDFAVAVARCVVRGEVEKGIVICGSGIGAAIAANKIAGARASVCHDAYSARQGVEHDDLNILCMGARVIGDALIETIANIFLSAKFDPQPRFIRRREKVRAIETGDTT